MWLDSTIWGDAILSGPIPGKEGLMDVQQSANIVTVCNVVDMPLLNDDEVVEKEHMIEVAKLLNSLENLGISLTDRQEQDERPSQIISQMPVLPLLSSLERPLLGRSEPPLFGRSVPPLLDRSVPLLLSRYKSKIIKDPDSDSYIMDFLSAGDKPPYDRLYCIFDSNYHTLKAKFNSFMHMMHLHLVQYLYIMHLHLVKYLYMKQLHSDKHLYLTTRDRNKEKVKTSNILKVC